MRRRDVLRATTYGLLYSTLAPALPPWRALAAPRWAVRPVEDGDQAGLVALMRACVADPGSFHGQCRALEWTSTWADDVVVRRPRSLVMTRDDELVAYVDLPNRKPVDPNPLAERNQRAFWCGAAGARTDLLGTQEARRVFRHLLYRTFSDASAMGFEYVRCAAPWPSHPSLAKPFAAYSGLTLTSFTDDGGALRYLIEWRLGDALGALAAEGAARALA